MVRRSAAPPSHVVVAAERVTKRYGGVAAVEGADFEVRRGELFSLLGPSGCGKTTLLRLIAGFEEPTSGAIRLEGVDVRGVPPYRRNVNLVFQQYALFPHLSVFDNVAFGPRAHGTPPAEVERRVRAMLDVVRLAGLAGRRPAQLSGGEKQRVALARALVNEPGALLLDEPLSALDLKLRRAMQVELKRIQREVGVSFVLVTHDQEEALSLSDRIAVMNAGRIEQVGTPEEVYDSPATAFVAGFIGEANLLPVTVRRVEDDCAIVRLPGGRDVEVPSGGRSFASGEAATLMVRPERVRVSREPSQGGAAASAVTLGVTLVDRLFRGSILRWTLRDAAGNAILAELGLADPAAHLEPGAAAWASWDRDAARLVAPAQVRAGPADG